MRFLLLWTFVLFCLPPMVWAKSLNSDPITQYISQYKEIAKSEMDRTGIPASIKMAQGILESNSGRSTLAVKAKNHFGIKCGNYWEGGTFYREDDDYAKGKLIKSCFRKFDNSYSSYIAHSDFLLNPGSQYRYGFLFELDPYDYKAWAHGLKKSGYATDPTYADKLIGIIEKYELYLLDVGSEPFLNLEEEIVADAEETSNPKGKSKDERIKSRKSSYFAVSDTEHIVSAGETMQSIADKYNIDIDLFYFQNRIKNGMQPYPGQTLLIHGQFHWGRRPKTYPEYVDTEQYLFEDGSMKVLIR